MQLSNKTSKSQYVLAVESESGYRAIKLPDSKVSQVDRILSSGKSISVGGKYLELEKIVGIFPAEEWENIRSVMLAPTDNYSRLKNDMEIYKRTGRHPRSKK